MPKDVFTVSMTSLSVGDQRSSGQRALTDFFQPSMLVLRGVGTVMWVRA